MNEEINLDEIIARLNESKPGGAGPKKEKPVCPEELDEETLNLLLGLCESKAEEFALMGYDRIKAEEIWQCVKSQYQNGYPPLHRMVNDILSLKTNKFMNWMTLKAYREL